MLGFKRALLLSSVGDFDAIFLICTMVTFHDQYLGQPMNFSTDPRTIPYRLKSSLADQDTIMDVTIYK